jgi:hypothetical protein
MGAVVIDRREVSAGEQVPVVTRDRFYLPLALCAKPLISAPALVEIAAILVAELALTELNLPPM